MTRTIHDFHLICFQQSLSSIFYYCCILSDFAINVLTALSLLSIITPSVGSKPTTNSQIKMQQQPLHCNGIKCPCTGQERRRWPDGSSYHEYDKDGNWARCPFIRADIWDVRNTSLRPFNKSGRIRIANIRHLNIHFHPTILTYISRGGLALYYQYSPP